MKVGWVVIFIVRFVIVKEVSNMLCLDWSFCFVVIVVMISVFRRIIGGYDKFMKMVNIEKMYFLIVYLLLGDLGVEYLMNEVFEE